MLTQLLTMTTTHEFSSLAVFIPEAEAANKEAGRPPDEGEDVGLHGQRLQGLGGLRFDFPIWKEKSTVFEHKNLDFRHSLRSICAPKQSIS